jgi:hypothetical protein
MWKEKFQLRIDAHPEDGFQTVDVSMDGDYWVISGLDINDLRLPNDDNVLAQISSVCELIVNHPDNPLNNVVGMPHLCIACGKEHFGCCGSCEHYVPISKATSEQPLESAAADVHFSSAGSKPAVSK